jgi:hypothetical protein
MKLDWKDAPEWARYLAMDASGWWYWYEQEPAAYRYRFIPEDGQSIPALEDQSWRDTLEKRP